MNDTTDRWTQSIQLGCVVALVAIVMFAVVSMVWGGDTETVDPACKEAVLLSPEGALVQRSSEDAIEFQRQARICLGN